MYFWDHSRPNVLKPLEYVVCRAARLLLVRLQASLAGSGPQCRADETMLLPPCSYVQLLPRDSMMSISPDAGHGPYVSCTGIIQMAGQSQSPCGSLAVTSTRPYLIVAAPFLVVIRPDLVGGTILLFPVVVLVAATQSLNFLDVQVPSLSRSMTVFFSMRAASWSVGLIHR